MKRRIRTTRQARHARAEALEHARAIRDVEEGTLTSYECTRRLPSGGTWTRRWASA